jgi:hypothetical protein
MTKLSYLLLLLIICITTAACEYQKQSFETEHISIQMKTLDKALMQKDTLTLSALLHDNLSMGHSNGWLETKPDLLKTLVEEGVRYTSIETIGEPKIKYSSENLLTTRRNIDVSGLLNQTKFEVKLNVLELWIFENDDWQLLARQSVNRRE